MICPVCRLDDNYVAHTLTRNDVIRRIRRCICGHRFTTYESTRDDMKRLRKLVSVLRQLNEDLTD